MKKKISSVEIQHFRGIPKTLKLDLWNKSADKPNSIIIFGDNGTGKSSIIDGLELVKIREQTEQPFRGKLNQMLKDGFANQI